MRGADGIVWALLGGIGFGQAGGVVTYVDARAAGAADGSSWANAFTDLHAALDAIAAAGGGEIRVAQGTYVPNRRFATGDDDPNDPRAVTFLLPDGVTLRGGYAGVGQADPDANDADQFPTILSGDVLGDDAADFQNREDNAYHVLMALDANVVLEGLVITAGSADRRPSSSEGTTHQGGGLYQQGGSLMLSKCIFRDNYAAGFSQNVLADAQHPLCNCYAGGGGALHAVAETLTIHDSIFSQNQSSCGGAGILEAGLITIESSEFHGNSASCGGGLVVDTAVLFARNTVFWENVAESDQWAYSPGGGISARADHAEFDACTFLRNSAVASGGAIHVFATSVVLCDCIVAENAARSAITVGINERSTIRGSTFRDNRARAVILESTSSALIEGCEFLRNGPGGACDLRGARELEISGCIFRENFSDEYGVSGAIQSGYGSTVIQDSMFQENSGDRGGAVNGNQLRITRSSFLLNTARTEAGALWASDFWMTDCLFGSNSAEVGGAAVLQTGIVDRCDFSGNRAAIGGAIVAPYLGTKLDIRNSLITGNEAQYYAGAVAGGAALLSITSSTVDFNRAGARAGGILADYGTVVRNSIVWGNSDPETPADAIEDAQIDGLDRAVVEYSSVEGWSGRYPGIGNEPTDPLLLSSRPWVDSPARDSGDPQLEPLPGESDLDGKPRVLCGRIDRGAYEYGLAGDVNCDQRVDAVDFERWAECESGPQAEPLFLGDCGPLDAHPDGRIDLHDFAVFQNTYEPGD